MGGCGVVGVFGVGVEGGGVGGGEDLGDDFGEVGGGAVVDAVEGVEGAEGHGFFVVGCGPTVGAVECEE